MAWIYIPVEVGEKISNICQQHFPRCSRCPLTTPCDAERENRETTGEYTRRWETSMAQAVQRLESSV